MVLAIVSGAFRVWLEFSHTQMRMLCIEDRYDALSIPNQDSGLILYHGVGSLMPSQEIFDAVDLFKEFEHREVGHLSSYRGSAQGRQGL